MTTMMSMHPMKKKLFASTLVCSGPPWSSPVEMYVHNTKVTKKILSRKVQFKTAPTASKTRFRPA